MTHISCLSGRGVGALTAEALLQIMYRVYSGSNSLFTPSPRFYPDFCRYSCCELAGLGHVPSSPACAVQQCGFVTVLRRTLRLPLLPVCRTFVSQCAFRDRRYRLHATQSPADERGSRHAVWVSNDCMRVRGVVLKKKWGTPETRLRQRF